MPTDALTSLIMPHGDHHHHDNDHDDLDDHDDLRLD